MYGLVVISFEPEVVAANCNTISTLLSIDLTEIGSLRSILTHFTPSYPLIAGLL